MKKIIWILLLALSFGGCVSIKARAITEKNNAPKYQLEAEYTIFQLGK